MYEPTNLNSQNQMAQQAEKLRQETEKRLQEQYFEKLNQVDQFQLDQIKKQNGG